MTTEQNKIVEQLYEDYRLYLYKYACMILGDKTDAEDAVHRTFEIVCEKNEIPDDPVSLPYWLRGILKNVLKHMARERNTALKHMIELTPDMEQSLSNMAGNELADYEINYIKPAEVSDEDFEMLKYKVLYGYSSEKIAQKFSLSKDACYKRIQRAKEKIRKNIRDER